VNRVLAAGILAGLAGHGQSIHFESAVNAQAPGIILDVGVEAIDGTPVSNLRQADFELLVDGVPRPLVSFSAENRSLVLAMLVDMSLSMGNLPIGEDDRNTGEDDRYHRTLQSVILQLETGDRATLGRVSAKPALSPVSSEPLALFSHVRDVLTVPAIERMGPSPLWDAVISAIDLVSGESGSRAVMLWTDGRSTGNRFGMADVIDRAAAAGVSVHILVEQFPPMGSKQPTSLDPCSPVVSIVAATGGSCLVNLRDRGLNVPPISPVRRAIRALHQRYVLGFQDDQKDGKEHELRVRVKRPGVVVRAPLRYRAGK
jgi:hypothetical protein